MLVWYWELASARGSGMNGTQRIAWADMLAWSALTGTRPTPSEVRLLQRIDTLVVSTVNSRRSGKHG